MRFSRAEQNEPRHKDWREITLAINCTYKESFTFYLFSLVLVFFIYDFQVLAMSEQEFQDLHRGEGELMPVSDEEIDESKSSMLNAFFYFAQEEQPKIKKSMPHASNADIAKEVGKQWNEAPSDVRAKYVALASKDKVQYMEKVKENQEAKGLMTAVSTSKELKECDEQKPKQE